MDAPLEESNPNVLLAAEPSLMRAVIREILGVHGYRVVMEGCGFSPRVIGHSFPGTIHLLMADMDFDGVGSGPRLAANLAYLRPHMHSLYYAVDSGTVSLLRNPGTSEEVRAEFTPGILLEWVSDLISSPSLQAS
jgi:hypothetical protein